MVNKCLETNCSTSYKTKQRKASFHFHEDQELKRKCIYFDNRKDWLPNAHSVICIEFWIQNYKTWYKNVNSCAVTSTSITYNHYDSSCNPSLLSTPTIPTKYPRTRNIRLNELVFFQAADQTVDIDSMSEQNSPEIFTLNLWPQKLG